MTFRDRRHRSYSTRKNDFKKKKTSPSNYDTSFRHARNPKTARRVPDVGLRSTIASARFDRICFFFCCCCCRSSFRVRIWKGGSQPCVGRPATGRSRVTKFWRLYTCSPSGFRVRRTRLRAHFVLSALFSLSFQSAFPCLHGPLSVESTILSGTEKFLLVGFGFGEGRSSRVHCASYCFTLFGHSIVACVNVLMLTTEF